MGSTSKVDREEGLDGFELERLPHAFELLLPPGCVADHPLSIML